MRPVLFIVCFAAGVGLMIFSGYLPKTASAQRAPDTAKPATDPLIQPPPVRPAPRHRTLSKVRQPEIHAPSVPNEHVDDFDELENPPADAAPEPSDEVDSDVSATLDQPADEPTEPDEEPTTDEPATPEPVAEAGEDRVAWVGWNEVRLHGGQSIGTQLTYDWKQISGPAQLQIENADRVVAAAYGLPVGPDMGWDGMLYEFELTVTDRLGRSSSDTVGVIVLTAPELIITPTPDRYFDERDGYLLGHYESWTVNTDGGASVFEVTSPVGLKFTPVAGGDYDLLENPPDHPDGEYVYEITVYQRGDEAASWLEFLVDTNENIPGILQLGVSWDGTWSQQRRPRRG